MGLRHPSFAVPAITAGFSVILLGIVLALCYNELYLSTTSAQLGFRMNNED
jgi:hypothetical protein